MPNVIRKEIYNGKIKIDFFPDSHRYKLAGSKEWLPSVTSITGILDKSRTLVPWASRMACQHLLKYLESSDGPYSKDVLLPIISEAENAHKLHTEEAADIGSKVHEWAERFALAKSTSQAAPGVPHDVDPRVLNGIEAFLKWVTSGHIKFIRTENLVYALPMLGEQDDMVTPAYVGIYDALVEIDGKRVLVDYKTSSGIYLEHKLQISGYWNAHEIEKPEEQIDYAVILKFDKTTGILDEKIITREEYEDHIKAFKAAACLKHALKSLEQAKW